MKAYVTPHDFPDVRYESECMRKLGGVLEEIYSESPQELATKSRDADALFVQYTRIPRELIEQLQHCKIILRYGIGYDNVDLKAAGEKGIYVCNVPHYCGDEVADHTMALLLAAARKLIPIHNCVQEGQWKFMDQKPIYSLNEKLLGLFGCGNIAQRVAKRAQSFGMRVIAYDPWLPKERADELGIELMELNQLCRHADFISLHLPLSDQTYRIVDQKLIQSMKDGVILINTSRGGLISTVDLKQALDQQKVAVACLDVVEEDPLSLNHPLIGHPSVVMTPHSAYYSEESLPRLQKLAAEEVYRVLTGNKPNHAVNLHWMNTRGDVQ